MKKVIRFLIISLAPIAIIYVYTALRSLASDYASRYYDMLPLMITVVLGYALIGVAIFLICKKALTQTDIDKFPYEFIVGIVLTMVPILSFFIPIYLPPFFIEAFSASFAISGLFISIYVCLSVVFVHRRAKSLKAKKEAQKAQP